MVSSTRIATSLQGLSGKNATVGDTRQETQVAGGPAGAPDSIWERSTLPAGP
jgi:hypothetical protein